MADNQTSPAPAGSYSGNDRRIGFDRRAATSKASAKPGPKIHSAIHIDGYAGAFKTGQEREFFEAANAANKRAKAEQRAPAVDLERLTAVGAISGFPGLKSDDEGTYTRSRQVDQKGKDAEIENADGHRLPGSTGFASLNPEPAPAGSPEPLRAAQVSPTGGGSASSGTAARTGGAGRTGGSGSAPSGERSAAASAAASGDKK